MPKDKPKRLRNTPRRRPKPQTGRSAAIWVGSFALLVIVLVLVIPLWLTVRARPKSVLLVTMDATRVDALGCNRGTLATTPSLDRLAAEGVRFSRCTTSSPLTLPSHCTLLTSTWPLVHGVRRDHGIRLIDDSETLAELLHSAGLATAAVAGSSALPEVSGLNQGFEKYDAVGNGAGASTPAGGSRPAREVTDRAIQALDSFGDRPFFLWANYHDPDLSTQGVAPTAQSYAAQVAAMDAEIGRLLQALDGSKRGQRTMVVLVGTQGESLGEHGEPGHGSFLYETTLRVPLILRCPAALPKNRLVEAPVRTIDLLPTILEYLGRPASAFAQGTSLRGLVPGTNAENERASFAETDLPAELFGLASLRSFTAKEWKYIDSPAPELYHLSDDPGETKNLAAEQPDRVEKMRKQLSEAMVAATQTSAGGDRKIHPSAQDRELLRSLGYVGEVGTTGGNAGAEPPDPAKAPRAHTAAIARYAEARRLLASGHAVEAEAALRAVLADLPSAQAPQEDLATVTAGSGGR